MFIYPFFVVVVVFAATAVICVQCRFIFYSFPSDCTRTAHTMDDEYFQFIFFHLSAYIIHFEMLSPLLSALIGDNVSVRLNNIFLSFPKVFFSPLTFFIIRSNKLHKTIV